MKQVIKEDMRKWLSEAKVTYWTSAKKSAEGDGTALSHSTVMRRARFAIGDETFVRESDARKWARLAGYVNTVRQEKGLEVVDPMRLGLGKVVTDWYQIMGFPMWEQPKTNRRDRAPRPLPKGSMLPPLPELWINRDASRSKKQTIRHYEVTFPYSSQAGLITPMSVQCMDRLGYSQWPGNELPEESQGEVQACA